MPGKEKEAKIIGKGAACGGSGMEIGMNYKKEEILRLVQEEDVEFIRLQFTDMFGTFKNVAITSSQLEKALDNRCMFDGSCIDGYVRIEESDMYLYPDLNTVERCVVAASAGKGGAFDLRCVPAERAAL